MTPCLSAVAVLLVIALFTVRAATRLDRLHVRTDAAWAALDGLLARRAVVVRTLAAAGCLPPAASDGLRTAADRALTVGPADREAAENELGGLLAMLDRESLKPGPAVELADAEQRWVIARRVYNDAVRDTRALRGRWGVRWLRLAGTAPRPRFFEIIEPRDEPWDSTSRPIR